MQQAATTRGRRGTSGCHECNSQLGDGWRERNVAEVITADRRSWGPKALARQTQRFGTTTILALMFVDGCPNCSNPWTEQPERLGLAPHRFADLAFRCESCGIGFSNAANPPDRVLIRANYADNVPPEVIDGLDTVLRSGLNVRARQKKPWAFASANSEDAASWTIARALASIGSLGSFLSPGLRSSSSDPGQALLWGVPLTAGAADAVAGSIVKVSDDLGEEPGSRSELDVILVWPDLIAFVEVKLDSPNDYKAPTYKGWDIYLPCPDLFARDDDGVRQAGWYELTRNWVIGNRVAARHDARFVLVNLGPAKLAKQAASFGDLLEHESDRAFEHRRWAELLDASPALPSWTLSYAAELGLEQR